MVMAPRIAWIFVRLILSRYSQGLVVATILKQTPMVMGPRIAMNNALWTPINCLQDIVAVVSTTWIVILMVCLIAWMLAQKMATRQWLVSVVVGSLMRILMEMEFLIALTSVDPNLQGHFQPSITQWRSGAASGRPLSQLQVGSIGCVGALELSLGQL